MKSPNTTFTIVRLTKRKHAQLVQIVLLVALCTGFMAARLNRVAAQTLPEYIPIVAATSGVYAVTDSGLLSISNTTRRQYPVTSNSQLAFSAPANLAINKGMDFRQGACTIDKKVCAYLQSNIGTGQFILSLSANGGTPRALPLTNVQSDLPLWPLGWLSEDVLVLGKRSELASLFVDFFTYSISKNSLQLVFSPRMLGSQASLSPKRDSLAVQEGANTITFYDFQTGKSNRRMFDQNVTLIGWQKSSDLAAFKQSFTLPEPVAPPAGPKFLYWPTYETRQMSRGYGNYYGYFHYGLDIIPGNFEIVSASSGRVTMAGRSSAWSLRGEACRRAGGIDNGDANVVIVETGGYQVIYLHMLDGLGVYAGQDILPGQRIGRAGNTGCSSGTHLHFEIRQSGYSGIDPWPLFVDNNNDGQPDMPPREPPAPNLTNATLNETDEVALLGWSDVTSVPVTHYKVKLERLVLTPSSVTWQPVSGGQIDTWVSKADVCASGSCTLTTPRLSTPTVYRYSVQAMNSSGTSPWSGSRTFTVTLTVINRSLGIQFASTNNDRSGKDRPFPNDFQKIWCYLFGFTANATCRQCATYSGEVLKAAGFPGLHRWVPGNDELFNVFSNNRNTSTDVNRLIGYMRQHPYIWSVDLNVVPSDLRPGDAIFYSIIPVGNGLGAKHSVIVTDHVKADGTPLLAYWNAEKYAIFNPAPARGNTPQYLTHDFMRASGFNGNFIVVRFKGVNIDRKVVPDMPTGATLVGTSLRINSPVADDWEYEISRSDSVVAEGLNQGNFRSTVAKGRVNASTRELNLSLPEGQYWLHVRHVRNGVASPWTVAKQVTVSRPPAPRLLAVANNATVIDTRRPTFRWTCSPLASRHEFTWWRSGGTYQTVTLGACTGTEMSYTPNVDMPIGGINWFVRAINGAGSAYSAYRWFEFRAPERATPIYPWGQWITSTRQPQMRFECGRHATSYVVQVRTDAGTPVHTRTLNPSWCSGGRLAFTPSIAFPNGNYVWSVTSVNAIGSVTSANANFRIMVQGIATPIITSPTNLQNLTTSNVTFAVIGGLPTVRYQLMDMGGNVIWTKNGGTSLTETLPNGTYRVRAMNVLGSLTSDWSPVVMFSVSNPCNGIVDRGEIVAGVGVGVPPTCQIQRFSVRVPSTGRLFIDGQTSDTVVTDRFIMRLTTDPEGRNIVRDIRPASTGRAVFWHAPNWWGGLTPGQLYYFWLIPQPGVTVHGLGLNLYGNWPVITSSWVVELSSDHNWAATWWYNTSRSIIISRIAGDVEYTVYVRTNNGAKLIATANSVNGYVNIPVYLEGAPTIVEIRPRSGFGTYRMGLNGAPGLPLTAPSFVPR